MIDKVNSTLFLSIISLVYVLMLTILFLTKKKVKTTELTLYKTIILTNLICLVSEGLITSFSILRISGIKVVLKFFNMAIFTYIFLLCVYSFAICIKGITKSGQFKQIFKTLYVLSIILIAVLPVHFNNVPKEQYSYGPSVNFLYVAVALISLSTFIITVWNIKKITIRKAFPIFTLISLLIINTIIQSIWPQILLVNSILSLVTFLMYHTIENPDIKIMEELNLARERADKANNAKTEFLSSMSHEIRTPLNAIDGFSQLILEENDINVIRDEAKDIMAASKNLLEIVNGILDISKIEANKLEIINVEYEPAKIFDEVAKLAKSRIGSKPVMFKQHIAEDLPDYLDGDYTRVKQITLNLLTNAVKYTKDGYVDYSVRCVKQDDVCRLIIMVKDTGIGIKSENIDKLFNKFERFDKENNITIEGTGLGLAITKKLVDLMGGKIIADSRYGVGSIFAVVIDQKIVDKVKQKDVVEKENRTTFDYARILVVDDNKINLKVVAKLLELYNIKVDLVDSGFECIEKIKSGTLYNLILMDDMMPQMSGTETFKKLKQLDNFNVPVVALTANAISGMREKYLSEGFKDYISKPIDKKELERVLNTYLN